MIRRAAADIISKYAEEYPAVTVMGPRQSGKSTLVKAMFPGYAYANLEDRETRELAETDARAFFSLYPAPVILDEIQKVPDLLSQVQVMIDEDRSACGRFILTGSHQAVLSSAISKSIAGRTAIVELLPLSMVELPTKDRKVTTDELMFRGFMPELTATRKDPVAYYRFYYRTYVERDVNEQISLRHRAQFDKFMRLLAGRVGQLVNLSSLSCEVGVSSTTLEEWISVLEASYVVFRLRPYFANVSKRLVKTPKIYFYETGLVCYLLGIENVNQLSRDPLRGSVFENMVVVNGLKNLSNAGHELQANFLRTSDGFEIDYLEKAGTRMNPVEIKSSMTFSKDLVVGLEKYLQKWDAESEPCLIYDGRSLITGSGIRCVNFRNC